MPILTVFNCLLIYKMSTAVTAFDDEIIVRSSTECPT